MKYIKVTGCHDCDKKYANTGTWMCKHPQSKDCMDIDIYIDSKSIHPDCPLDDCEQIEEVLEPITELKKNHSIAFRSNCTHLLRINYYQVLRDAIEETLRRKK